MGILEGLPGEAGAESIEWNDVLSAVAGVMAVALLMIGIQTLKVARSNPAEVLKNE